MKTKNDIITDMCYTWRHDYGLTKQEHDGPGGSIESGLTDTERKILWQQMSQLFDRCIEPHMEFYKGVVRATVRIRRDLGKQVRPNAEQLEGKTYTFKYGWTMDEDDPYPGEEAWLADDPNYPDDAPPWIASGDLFGVKNERIT